MKKQKIILLDLNYTLVGNSHKTAKMTNWSNRGLDLKITTWRSDIIYSIPYNIIDRGGRL